MAPLRRLYLGLLLLLIGGCSLQPPQPPAPAADISWEERRQRLDQQNQWLLRGKVGIRQGQEITSASLNWTQQQDRYHIFMAGPMGQGAVDIRGNAHRVELNVSGEGRYYATTPEQLLQQRLGWSLPISNLYYWVRGLPAPGAPFQKQLDPQNRLHTLNQDNWEILYRDYQASASGDLPARIIMRQGRSLKVTLVIKEWELG